MSIEFEKSYWEKVDYPIYEAEISPFLPPTIFDFHTHAWRWENFRQPPSEDTKKSASLVFVAEEFPAEQLVKTADQLFPGKRYRMQAFGFPFAEIDEERNNEHIQTEIASGVIESGLMLVRPTTSSEQIREGILRRGFVGIKPYWTFVTWKSKNDVLLSDMLTDDHLQVANELGCIVLIHLPRKGRLADPENIKALERISAEFPNAKLIIAHVGRAYCEWPVRQALHLVEGLPNVYFDTTFIQNSTVFQMLFEHVDSSRIFYGSDFPNSAVHGQVVCVNGVNLFITRDVYPWSLSNQNDPIEATYMAYESIRAIRDGGDRAGLSPEDVKKIFHDNAMNLIKHFQQRISEGSF